MSDASPFPKAPWPRPLPLPLTGHFVTLTPLDADADAAELFAISHRDEETKLLWRYLASGPFPDASAHAAYLREWTARPDVLAFTVRSTATREALGNISLMAIRPEHGVAELGNIWYAPHARRTKANTEASYLLLRHCFAELGYRRMEWKCNTDNEPSARAARRLGFTYEGTFRQHMVVKGRSRDTAWFAMLDHEWPRFAAAMEHWLYTDDTRSLASLRENT
ncbi:MAG: GNAT family N-acetyltransferase [Burkholderiales bacterium]|nr:GNAT family N-acetyltransferase [Opitutaceae bacterium]